MLLLLIVLLKYFTLIRYYETELVETGHVGINYTSHKVCHWQ